MEDWKLRGLWYKIDCPKSWLPVVLTGSLSIVDGDGKENDKKAIGLDWQNNNFARASHFSYISLPLLHDLNVHVLSRTATQDKNVFFLFLTFDTVL